MASRRPEPIAGMALSNKRGTLNSVSILDAGTRICETVNVEKREILPTIYETPLCSIVTPSLLTASYLILPKPTVEYLTRPHDMEISLADLGSSLLDISRKHRICENVAAFASHWNGTNPLLTKDHLPLDLLHVHAEDNQFTIWYNLTFYDSTPMKIIKCNPWIVDLLH